MAAAPRPAHKPVVGPGLAGAGWDAAAGRAAGAAVWGAAATLSAGMNEGAFALVVAGCNAFLVVVAAVRAASSVADRGHVCMSAVNGPFRLH